MLRGVMFDGAYQCPGCDEIDIYFAVGNECQLK